MTLLEGHLEELVRASPTIDKPGQLGGENRNSIVQGRDTYIWLVEQEPVKPYLVDGIGEIFKIHRLDNITVNIQPVALHNIRLLA